MRTEIYKNEYEGLNRVERRRLERKNAKDATNYFDLRKAAEKAIAACPMNCENGLLIDTEGREYHCCCCYDLRAALKGGGGE